MIRMYALTVWVDALVKSVNQMSLVSFEGDVMVAKEYIHMTENLYLFSLIQYILHS